MANFNLSELMEECKEESETNSPNYKVFIEGEQNLYINADRNRLEQVIVNLVSNAIKYAPGSDKVIIRTEKLTDGIKISITDFGIGIAKDQISSLFDRFYRVDENSQRNNGLGLGLFISSEIIKQHQAHIYVESEEGKGSTFWFVVPN